MDNKEIKIIEDISLNAWPSHQMQLYDGWILRFSHFYTHRTNCIEQIGNAVIPVAEKTDYCERVYRRWNTPCIFKITPLTDASFDKYLEDRGYVIQHETDVMCRDLSDIDFSCSDEDVAIERRISDEWIDALFAIKGNATVTHLKIVPSMYAAIPKDIYCACIRQEGRIVCTGLCILDREYAGIYAINTDTDFRRRNYAERICLALLREGKKAGAKKAYLQVVSSNHPAISLYDKLGFEKEYRYWFRVKNI